MPFSVGNLAIRSPVLLAPMAGITDAPFRRLVARFGAGLVVSEMVASREIVEAHKGARARAEIGGTGGVPTSVQIAGREARWMAEAARIAEARGADLIDINMGCPAKKVTGGWSGAALMRAPDHALSLIEAVVKAVRVPVTLKMRLGWDADEITAPDLARRAEEAGVAMIAVHGRTRAQFYKGRADWAAIAQVRRAVSVPLVANGDVTDAASAQAALAASGADAVMVGRGAQGAPWVPARIAAALEGRAFAEPGLAARRDLILEHREAMLGFYGRELGVRVARKHLVWALERIPGMQATARAVVRLDAPEAVAGALRDGFAAAMDERAAA
ncbi:MAG: tRNA dihydrouridine synthase DusB [Rubrimonas sp.]|uniref:tRNA dihydrouridine synthase DusB n=1 Tax=Rubrimonas sp. TaxID=2036015 RepID=UPI002FDE43E0